MSEPTATVYVVGPGGIVVDCDRCHAPIDTTVSAPPVAIGSAWLAEALKKHAETCHECV